MKGPPERQSSQKRNATFSEESSERRRKLRSELSSQTAEPALTSATGAWQHSQFSDTPGITQSTSFDFPEKLGALAVNATETTRQAVSNPRGTIQEASSYLQTAIK